MTNSPKKLQIKVASFRRMESPFEAQGKKVYMAIANVKNLPEALGEEWREGINPRDPNPNSWVSKKIRSSLTENPAAFLFKNRGITILAEDVTWDQQTGYMEITLTDPKRNGLLDGGHTFEVISEHIRGLKESGDIDALNACVAHVKIELLQGFNDLDEAIDIVEARNTSAQVKDQSLDELRGEFARIHNVLDGQSYGDRIAYAEMELREDGSKKDIDIKEILSYLICFDGTHFDRRKHPIKAYSSKKSVLDHFIEHKAEMEKLIPLLPDILKLENEIQLQLPTIYNDQGGKFGKVTGVEPVKGNMQATELPFIGKESDYRIPNAFIYPILAAFRPLVDCDGATCRWSSDPFAFFEKVKVELVTRVMEQAMEFRNPTKMGKDNATWGRCYDLVMLELADTQS
jgi:hypothetical protein